MVHYVLYMYIIVICILYMYIYIYVTYMIKEQQYDHIIPSTSGIIYIYNMGKFHHDSLDCCEAILG